MQPSNKDTYQSPSSFEATPSLTFDTEQLRQEAMGYATGRHEVDANDIDRRRVEDMGASMVAAAESVSAAAPEVYFDPTDPMQLLNCGRGTIFLRVNAMKGYGQSDVDLAA